MPELGLVLLLAAVPPIGVVAGAALGPGIRLNEGPKRIAKAAITRSRIEPSRRPAHGGQGTPTPRHEIPGITTAPGTRRARRLSRPPPSPGVRSRSGRDGSHAAGSGRRSSEAATRAAEADRRRRRVEVVAHRWGLFIVPSVLGLFDGDHAARLYHTTYARPSVVEHGLRGRAYLAAPKSCTTPGPESGKGEGSFGRVFAGAGEGTNGWARDVLPAFDAATSREEEEEGSSPTSRQAFAVEVYGVLWRYEFEALGPQQTGLHMGRGHRLIRIHRPGRIVLHGDRGRADDPPRSHEPRSSRGRQLRSSPPRGSASPTPPPASWAAGASSCSRP